MNSEQNTVLIVDDERSIRLSLRTILSGLGFMIVEAARGEEALALTRTAQFDAVLLDINMPGMGGVEVCRMMRKNSARLPIIMLTVQGSEDRFVAPVMSPESCVPALPVAFAVTPTFALAGFAPMFAIVVASTFADPPTPAATPTKTVPNVRAAPAITPAPVVPVSSST